MGFGLGGNAWLVENRSGDGLLGPAGRPDQGGRRLQVRCCRSDGSGSRRCCRRLASISPRRRSGVEASRRWPRRALVFGGSTHNATATHGRIGQWAIDVIGAPANLRGGWVRCCRASRWSLLDAVSWWKRSRRCAPCKDGDLVGAGWITGGFRPPAELLSRCRAAIDTAASLTSKRQRGRELAAALSGALDEQRDRREAATRRCRRCHRSDHAMAAVAGSSAGWARSSTGALVDRLTQQRTQAEAGRAETLTELRELEDRLRLAEEEESGLDDDGAGAAKGRVGSSRPRRIRRRCRRDQGPSKSKHDWPCAPPRNVRIPSVARPI